MKIACFIASAALAWAGTGMAASQRTAGDAYRSEPDLALNKSVIGSAICKPGEEAAKAVNGKVASKTQDKFCTLRQPGWFRVDLGSAMPVRGFTVKHAGAGGEPVAMNTRAFKIRVSPDGTHWRTVVTEFTNTASITRHRVATTQARYVEMQVTQPTQTDDPATRIYELEVW